MSDFRHPRPVPQPPGPGREAARAFLAVLRLLLWLIAGEGDPAWA